MRCYRVAIMRTAGNAGFGRHAKPNARAPSVTTRLEKDGKRARVPRGGNGRMEKEQKQQHGEREAGGTGPRTPIPPWERIGEIPIPLWGR